jgi:hypothetical protein
MHDGKHYEIRCAFDGYTVHVRAFLDGRPANGFGIRWICPSQLISDSGRVRLLFSR